MIVHLVDGTYELYRHFYGRARYSSSKYAAVDGVLAAVTKLLNEGTGPVGVATDHVIESFRNDLHHGYKTSYGMEPEILEQIPVLEDRLRDIGVAVWPMVDFEADDALASAARVASQSARVHQVRIYSPDKDLAQCVSGRRVIQVDVRTQTVIDGESVRNKYGIQPSMIPDYLALVGDTADGYPGVPGWGSVSTRTVLAAFGKIDHVPLNPEHWRNAGLNVRGAANLVASLHENADDVRVFLALSTLVTTIELCHESPSGEAFLSSVY